MFSAPPGSAGFWSFAEEDIDNMPESARAQSDAIRELVDKMWGALAANDSKTLEDLFGDLCGADTGIISQLGFGGTDVSSDATGTSGELLSPGVALKLLPKLWSSSLPVSLVYVDASKCGAATASIPVDCDWAGAKDVGFLRCLAALDQSMTVDPCLGGDLRRTDSAATEHSHTRGWGRRKPFLCRNSYSWRAECFFCVHVAVPGWLSGTQKSNPHSSESHDV